MLGTRPEGKYDRLAEPGELWVGDGQPAGWFVIDLVRSNLLPAIRGEMLTRLGRPDRARSKLVQVIELCGNAAERASLQRKVDGLGERLRRP